MVSDAIQRLRRIVFIAALVLAGCTGNLNPKQLTEIGQTRASSSGASKDISTTPPAAIDLTQFQLTFSDEFQSLSISNGTFDGSKWYTHTVQCCMSATNTAGGLLYPGDVYGYNTPNPFSLISGGGLEITAATYTDSAHLPQGPLWYSGLIASVDAHGNGFSQKYGYFEMSAKFPNTPGTWPAFWLNSVANLKGDTSLAIAETDIVEQYGSWNNIFHTNIHNWSQPSDSALNFGQAITVSDTTDTYHRYGFLWNETYMAVYFDGNLVYQAPTGDAQKQAFYLIANLGVGGGFSTAQTANPSKMQIAYIRAYQVAPQMAAPASTPAPAPAGPVIPGADATWTPCAQEGQTCSFDGYRTIRYGINGVYNTMIAHGSIGCSPSTFMDPVPGVAKVCEISSVIPSGVGWVHCAVEGQTCAVTGAQTVRFGLNGTYFSKSVNGAVVCNGGVFGDPLPGKLKLCEVQTNFAGATVSATPVPAPTATPVSSTPGGDAGAGWSACAQEGQTCSFSGYRTVRYGINGVYNTMIAHGSVACSPSAFMDPVPGVAKVCEISSVIPSGTGWVHCAVEGQTCAVTGAQTVRFGTDGAYFAKTVNGSVTCNGLAFGDPVPGKLKLCEVQTDFGGAASTPVATPVPTPAATPAATPVPTPMPTPQPTPAPVASSSNTLRIMPLGDSITWGWSDPTGNGYRGPLYDSLTQRGFNVQFVGSVTNGTFAQPANQGRPGATTSEVQAWIDPGAVATYQPDIVLLLLGGNNMLQAGQAGTGYPSTAINDLNSLIDDVRAQRPGVRIFVATITDLSRYPASTYVPRYNAEISSMVSARMTAGQKISLVDLNSAISISEMVDGIHPTQAGYAKLAATWYQALMQFYTP